MRSPGITDARHDVAVLIECAVDGGGEDLHIGMRFVQGGDALRAGEQADELDGLGGECSLSRSTAATAELPVASIGSTNTTSRSWRSLGILK